MLALGRAGRAGVRRGVRRPATGRTDGVLDPSGVVKGWAVERAAAAAARAADTDFCLSAGGDMVCRTLDPDGRAVADRHRGPARPRAASLAVVPVRTGAVATSGTAHRGAAPGRRPHRPGARRASPRSPSLADSLTWADIDATAAYAHGPDAADWLRTRPGRTGLVVWADGTTTTVTGPPG